MKSFILALALALVLVSGQVKGDGTIFAVGCLSLTEFLTWEYDVANLAEENLCPSGWFNPPDCLASIRVTFTNDYGPPCVWDPGIDEVMLAPCPSP